MFGILRLFSPVEVQAHLPVSCEQVYEVLADPETYPSWLIGAQRIRRVDPDFPAPASRFEHSVGATGEASVDDASVSLRAEPPHRLVLDVRAGLVHGTVDFRVEEEPGGCRLVFRECPTGPPILITPLLRPALFARNTVSVRQLRDLLRARNGDS
jgi:uncharacterized protein YndB with AHSA1/START domain